MKIERPEITDVEFTGKIYTIKNELTRFRYDTLIAIDKTVKEKEKVKARHKYQHDITALKRFSPVAASRVKATPEAE